MSSTAMPLTDDERIAAVFAVADDLNRLAADLQNMCAEFLNAKLGEHEFRARDVAGTARSIGNLVAPLDLLIGEGVQ